MTSRALASALVALVALAPLACASAALRDYREARDRYDACVASSGPESCAAERERMLAAEHAYEDAAAHGWGCDPKQPDCPTPH